MYIQQSAAASATMNLTLSSDQKRRTIYIDNMSALALPIHLFRIYHHIFSDIEDISVKRRQDRSTQYAFIRFRSVDAINMKPNPEALFAQREIFQQGDGCQYLLLSHKSLDNNTSTGVSVVWVLNSDAFGCPTGVSIVDVENDTDGNQILARLLSSKQKKKVQDRQEYPLVLEAQRMCSRYKWSQNGFVRPCYHYSTRNSCPAGDACGFLHDDKIYETVQMLLVKRAEQQSQQPQSQRTSAHTTPSTSPQATPNASPRWSPRGFKTPPHVSSPPLAPHIDRRTAMSPLSFENPYVDQIGGGGGSSTAISSSSSLSSSPLHFSPPRLASTARQCLSFSNSSSPGSSSPTSSMPTTPRIDGHPLNPFTSVASPVRSPPPTMRSHFAVISDSMHSSSDHLVPAQKAAESTSSFLFGTDDDELTAAFSPLSLSPVSDSACNNNNNNNNNNNTVSPTAGFHRPNPTTTNSWGASSLDRDGPSRLGTFETEPTNANSGSSEPLFRADVATEYRLRRLVQTPSPFLRSI